MERPYALLKPIPHADRWIPEPDPADVLHGSVDPHEIDGVIYSLGGAMLIVLDVETRGTDTWKPDTAVVGVGLAWTDRAGTIYAKYFDWASLEEDERRRIWKALGKAKCDLIAHNVPFDSALCSMQMDRDFGVPAAWGEGNPDPSGFAHRLPFSICTYGLLRRLASEGWPGQSWSLKSAMTELLQWDDTNEAGIDEWLLSRGYHSVGPRLVDGESPEDHLRAIRDWIAVNPEKRAKKVRPNKAEMWRVPAPILGRYCILDCLATLDLYVRVLRPALDRFPEFEEFHRGPWMDYVRAQCDQQYTGIRVLRHRLVRRREKLKKILEKGEVEIRAHPRLGAAISTWEFDRAEAIRAEIRAKEPAKYRKLPKLSAEPPKYKRDGTVSARWEAWDVRRREIEALGEGEVSANWTNWRARLDAVDSNAPKVNLRSGPAMRWLLYQSGVVEWKDGEAYEKGKRRGSIWIKGRFGWIEVDRTKSGALPTGRDALAQLAADLEGPLAKFTKAHKELTFVEQYEPLLYLHPDRTWRIHPGWIAPGTKTGRLSGKKPSLHQIPKSLEFLDCFVPNRGYVWLEFDWSALEPHVLAELSRDDGLLQLFGPGANPNHDRYLFTLANILHTATDEVRKYYDPRNPTKEGVSAAKAACKMLRELGKILVLSGDYGAGARKKFRASAAKGVSISFDEMREIHDAQSKIHAGVAEFAAGLEKEWKARGGWVLNGLGFPTPVFEDYLKDLVNRVVQSSGHDAHTICLWILYTFLVEAEIRSRGIIDDFHDQLLREVPAGQAAAALEVARAAVREVNTYLGSYVQLKAEPRIVRSLAEGKMEEAHEKREAERRAEKTKEVA